MPPRRQPRTKSGCQNVPAFDRYRPSTDLRAERYVLIVFASDVELTRSAASASEFEVDSPSITVLRSVQIHRAPMSVELYDLDGVLL